MSDLSLAYCARATLLFLAAHGRAMSLISCKNRFDGEIWPVHPKRQRLQASKPMQM